LRGLGGEGRRERGGGVGGKGGDGGRGRNVPSLYAHMNIKTIIKKKLFELHREKKHVSFPPQSKLQKTSLG
jgi:hypothetical protein